MDIAQTDAIRSNLTELQRVDRSQGVVSNELATGRKDPRTNILAASIAKGLSDRAGDLAQTKNNINEGLNSIRVADQGLSAIEDTLKIAGAVADEYERTSDPARQAQLQEQYDTLTSQINGLAEDASYNGINLISSTPDNQTVGLNETGSTSLTIEGQASDSASLGLGGVPSTDEIQAALSQVRSSQSSLGSNASTLEIRGDFTEQLTNNLESGAAELVNSNLTEDAAQALSLETRQQLGTASLSIANQSQQAVLGLF